MCKKTYPFLSTYTQATEPVNLPYEASVLATAPHNNNNSTINSLVITEAILFS